MESILFLVFLGANHHRSEAGSECEEAVNAEKPHAKLKLLETTEI
jgi:hypothetical protein